MNDPRHLIRATMRAMIDRLGCYDAAAEVLNARWGGGHSKGTISKKLSGSADFTVLDVIAFEDATGSYPITKFMARRLKDDEDQRDADLLSAGSAVAKETGEAISAILACVQSDGAGERAQAIKEGREAVEALKGALAILEQGDDA